MMRVGLLFAMVACGGDEGSAGTAEGQAQQAATAQEGAGVPHAQLVYTGHGEGEIEPCG